MLKGDEGRRWEGCCERDSYCLIITGLIGGVSCDDESGVMTTCCKASKRMTNSR